MASKDADSKKLLGKRVAQAVSAAGYGSPDEFARGIGLPRSTFFKLRHGTLDPRFSTLMKIARGLDLSLSALVGDERGKIRLASDGDQTAATQSGLPTARTRSLGARKSPVQVTLSIEADEAPMWLVDALAQVNTKPKPRPSKKSPSAT